MRRKRETQLEIPEGTEMVVPTRGIIIGQKAVALALNCSRKSVATKISEGIMHPQVPQPGHGSSHCFRAEEIAALMGDLELNPIPAYKFIPDSATPADAESREPAPRKPPAAAGTSTPLRGDAAAAGSDPQRQPPPARTATPAEPAEFTQPDEAMVVDVVLTQTGMGADQVMREEIRHMGDLESSFDFALHHPGRYAVKRIEPESGAAILIREIDTGAEQSISPSISGSGPAATPATSSPSLHNPGAFAAAEPPAMLPTPVSSSDRMMEMFMSLLVSQIGKVDPTTTVAEMLQMWREGRESGAEIADEVGGPFAGETNIFDVLNTVVEHVGPNIGEIVSLALLRGGNNGNEPGAAGDPADARQIDRPAAA